MRCLIIAEAGVNHNGDLGRALEMVDAAADAGVDAIKFQSFRADTVVVRGTAKADYQRERTGAGDQFEMIQALELGEEQHYAIVEHCVRRGVEFMSTPFDAWSASLLLKLGIKRIKIASGEVTNKPFIQGLARSGLPLILSTGMSTLDEVCRSVEWLRISHPRSDTPDWLTLLHCTSNYPALSEDVNLGAMVTMREAIGLPVGYSDHTLGLEISLAAVALGAEVVEKHFTLDCGLPGPDHHASLDPRSLAELVRSIRSIESAIGDGKKEPRASELPVRALVRRSAFFVSDMSRGDVIGIDDLRFLRPGDGIGPEHVESLVGRRVRDDVVAGRKLSWDDLV